MQFCAVSNLVFIAALLLPLFGCIVHAVPIPCQGCIFGGAVEASVSPISGPVQTKIVEAFDSVPAVVPTGVNGDEKSCPGCIFLSTSSAEESALGFTSHSSAMPMTTSNADSVLVHPSPDADTESCPGCVFSSAALVSIVPDHSQAKRTATVTSDSKATAEPTGLDADEDPCPGRIFSSTDAMLNDTPDFTGHASPTPTGKGRTDCQGCIF